MAVLVPLPASGITASYTTATKTLKVSATGKVPGSILSATLQRDQWMGGLKFSLMGYYGGLGDRSAEQTITVSKSETISLPMKSFNSKTIIVETSLGLNTITIDFDGAGIVDTTKPTPSTDTNKPTPGTDTTKPTPSTGPTKTTPIDDPSNHITTTVLQTIDQYLPKDKVMTISARIPKEDPVSGVFTKFNKEYLQMLDATVRMDTITYTFQWAKVPPSTVSVQMLEITTSVWNEKIGSASRGLWTVQGYAVRPAVVG